LYSRLKSLLFFLPVLLTGNLFSAVFATNDSLYNILSQSGSSQLSTNLNVIFEDLLRTNPSEGLSLGFRIASRIENEKNEKLFADYCYYMGSFQLRLSSEDISESYFSKALQIRRKQNDTEGLIRLLIKYAYLKIFFSDYNASSEMLMEAENLNENQKSPFHKTDINVAKAILYYIVEDRVVADSVIKAAITEAEYLGYEEGLNLALEHQGIISIALKKYDEAETVLLRAEKSVIAIGDKLMTAGLYDNLATLYTFMGQSEKAIDYVNKGLSLKKEMNYKWGDIVANSILGSVYFNMGKRAEALKLLEESFTVIQEKGYKRGIRTLASILANLNERAGNADAALKYFKIYKNISDSLRLEENLMIIESRKVEGDQKKKEAEIEKQAATARLNNLYITAVLFAGLLSLFMFVYVWLNRTRMRNINDGLAEKNKQLATDNDELEDLHQRLEKTGAEKNMLFGVFSHDIKNPVMAVMGYSEMLYEDYETMTVQEIRENLLKAKNAGVNLSNLTDNVLNWSLLNLDRLTVKNEVFAPAEVADKVLNIIESHAALKNISVKSMADSAIRVSSDPNLYALLIRNFLTNAVKFTQPGKTVELTILMTDDTLITVIKDQGLGMSDEIIDEILSGKAKSRRGTGSEKGTGLGLIICKAALEKLSGTMEIESALNEGTRIVLRIPVSEVTA